MREPSFWRRNGLAAQLLAPAAALYGGIAGRRMRQAGVRAGVPVLCVGNLTAGGAGKTPTALALGKLLLARGVRPAFLTRGYGGSQTGPLMVAPGHRASEVGDEALLLARLAPTVVARDRVTGAVAAVAAGARVIVMDDGFQNPALDKDVSLLVIDGALGIGNGRVIPAGPLRAPLAAQLVRASAVLAVGAVSAQTAGLVARARSHGLAVLTGHLAPDAAALDRLRGRPVLAFAGIGHPAKFFATLADNGVAVKRAVGFPDHHPFTARDAGRLLDLAAREGLALATTEKDMARLRGDPALDRLAAATTALPVTMAFDDDAAVRRHVIDRLLGSGTA